MIHVVLRDVVDDDVEVFYEQQLDAEATAMAAFPPRSRPAHFAHWEKIRADPACMTKAIVVGDAVAGNIGSWTQDGEREVGYWIGKEYWGRGIATAAVQQILPLIADRPLFAWVVRHNKGSIRVLEKAGFLPVGEEDDHLIYRLD